MSIRSNTARTVLIALLAAGVAALLVVLLFPSQATTAAMQSPGALVRVAADYDYSGERSTDNESEDDGAGGTVLWNRTITTPSNANTLYITFSGTGDSHDGAATELACLVNGHTCPNNSDSDGWTKVQKFAFECEEFEGPFTEQLECSEGDGGGGPGDWHDNNVNLTWCHSIQPGRPHHNVQVKLATSDEEDSVYVEDMTFIVDAAFTPSGCRNLDAADAADSGHGS